VERALKSLPSSPVLYTRNGDEAFRLDGNKTYFNPGSSAIRVLDGRSGVIRKPTSKDVVKFIRLTDGLPHCQAQSTAIVPADIPHGMADSYRLYLSLLHSPKPVVTGIFSREGFAAMAGLLALAAGGEQNLRKKPFAIFDACPTSPLKWSALTCHSVVEAAKRGIPSTIISMPLAGATSPVTLSGTLAQHTAEVLSGVVLSQAAHPGAPVLYGGSPAIMDMRKGTTPMGAVESMMLAPAFARIGKKVGLPVQAYLGLTDAKELDAQGGMEAAAGALLAVLGGIDLVSGPGMMDFQTCQSLEKLYVDHDLCAIAYRLKEGIALREDPSVAELMDGIGEGETFITHPHTRKRLREEQHYPSEAINRDTFGAWEAGGKPSLLERARKGVSKILDTHSPPLLEEGLRRELGRFMRKEAKKFGLEKLPLE
jgi:trimethylamine--corrinoid protein Co-methyltransferase